MAYKKRSKSRNLKKKKEIRNIGTNRVIGINNIEIQNNQPVVDTRKNPAGLRDEIRAVMQSMTTLDSSQRAKFEKMLIRNENIFLDHPGCINNYEHKISLNTEKPFVRQSYPIPLKYREAVDEEISSMIKHGIIERSISCFCNPIRIMQKKIQV